MTRWTIIALASLTVCSLHAADATPGRVTSKMRGLIFNQDCTDLFYSHEIKDGVDGGAVVDEYVDLLAQAGVVTLMINTNARKTNYQSDVWETFWAGYDPNGPDDQPFLQPIPQASRPGWRRMIHSMWAMDHQGIDYVARMASRARQDGISPWVSLRMNDVHENDNLAHPFHGAMWREEKYFRGGSMPYYARGLDYAHPEVRDMYRKLIVETLQRYDLNGLELDFMREPYLFREGQEAAGAAILRDWLRGIRRLTKDAGVRRGHPVQLAVRVPSQPEVALGWGLDAEQWSKDGLVDLIVVTPRWATLEYDMPLREWQKLLAGTGVTVAGGLEILHRPLPGGEAHPVNPEQARGAAAAVLAGTADAVYLFNYFGTMAHPSAWGPEYVRSLKAMSSLQELRKLPRRHAVTWRDITGPGEQYQAPLPAEGTALDLPVNIGPAPVPTDVVTIELTLDGAESAAPAVVLNGKETALQGREGQLLTYLAPTAALSIGTRAVVKIAAADGKPVRVVGLEVRIIPKP